MFIEIGQDIFDEILHSGSHMQTAHEVLERLCIAHKYKKHIVFSEYISNDLLSKIRLSIDNRSYQCLVDIYKNRKDYLTIKGILCITTLVTFSKTTGLNNNTIIINPGQDSGFEFWEETHLLTENILDSKFYNCIVKYYLRCFHIEKKLLLNSFLCKVVVAPLKMYSKMKWI